MKWHQRHLGAHVLSVRIRLAGQAELPRLEGFANAASLSIPSLVPHVEPGAVKGFVDRSSGRSTRRHDHLICRPSSR